MERTSGVPNIWLCWWARQCRAPLSNSVPSRPPAPMADVGNAAFGNCTAGSGTRNRSFDPRLLDGQPRQDPGIDAAGQRPHSVDAALAQLHGDPDGAGFVGTCAVDDDFAVARNLGQRALQIVQI